MLRARLLANKVKIGLSLFLLLHTREGRLLARRRFPRGRENFSPSKCLLSSTFYLALVATLNWLGNCWRDSQCRDSRWHDNLQRDSRQYDSRWHDSRQYDSHQRDSHQRDSLQNDSHWHGSCLHDSLLPQLLLLIG